MIYIKIQKENLMLFGASLIIAIFLWLQAHTQVDPISKEGFALMLNVKNFPEGMVITKKNERIGIIVEGPISVLKTFTLDSVEAYVDLSKAKIGTHSYLIKLNTKELHGLSITPKHSTESLNIEKLIKRSIPITIKEKGIPPNDILYDKTYCKPSFVNVVGPSSNIKRIDKAYATLDLATLSLNSTYLSNIQLLDLNNIVVENIKSDISTVLLTVSTISAPVQKRVPINISWKGSLPFGYSLKSFNIKPNQVIITGTSTEIAQINSVETLPVDLNSINRSQTIKIGLVPLNTIQIKETDIVEIDLHIILSSSHGQF